MAFKAEQAYELIEAAHQRGRLAHAFLISGARGAGKEELAARVIRLLEGPKESGGMDLFGEPVVETVTPLDELTGEWVRVLRPQSKSRKITVEAIRELEKSLHRVAGGKTWKVGVIVDADRLVTAAENAFLKTLEEPPPQTLLLLLTENPGAMLPTVLSRCVRLPLMGAAAVVEGPAAEFMQALDWLSREGLGQPMAALGLKACFSDLLAQTREKIDQAGKELLKEEEKALKGAVEGDWFKRREEAMKAEVEADYLNERAKLFDLLQSFMADVMRQKVGGGGLELPTVSAATKRLADAETMPGMIRRMDALHQLRQTLETNAQEQLALEVGFLKVFG
ncbi:MAG: hypothetical protein MUF31_00370 [Akkermansiaceae bacterium]|jgi:DNA polymerase-3 subunit delta'|nr:hypothetical protein [Akkermansiaceae bacterium]